MDDDDSGDAGGNARHDVGELVVVAEDPQLLLFRYRGQLRRAESGVDEDRVRADRRRRDHQLDHAAVVAAQDPDPVTGPHPGR